MKLGLLGFPISHSLSPMLYEKLLGNKLTSYEKFSIEKSSDVPLLSFFQNKLDGLNITSPYKAHFLGDVQISSEVIRKLGGINTIAFTKAGIFGTNTDYLAVKKIIEDFISAHGKINIILIGDGVMARVTSFAAAELGVSLKQYSRKLTPDFLNLDLRHQSDCQTIIINSCSRDFIFNFPVTGKEIFWDYNYSFLAHETTLPSIFKTYINGQAMLELQAKEAITFWRSQCSILNI